jgi:DNA polymerase III sliding clamp (beta) subunit (PCNA family)
MNKATFNTIKRVCGSKSLPIIQKTVHVDANGLTATNLDTFIKVMRPDGWHVTGAGVISLDILATLIDARSVSIIFDAGLSVIDVDGQTITATAMDSRDFPEVPVNDEALKYTGQFAGQDAAAVLDFVGKDIFRLAMTGVYIGEHIVATNGHIMRYRRSNYIGAPFILRREAVEAVKVQAVAGKMFKGPAQYWAVHHGAGYVALYRGDVAIYTRPIDEKYPNYLAVIPGDNEKTLTVDVSEMTGALKKLAPIYKAGGTKAVALEINGPGAVKMSAKYLTSAAESSTAMAADVRNCETGFRIGFNADYLATITSNVNADAIVLEIGEAYRAAIVNREILLMPVMLPA